jgi:hypothetical protein
MRGRTGLVGGNFTSFGRCRLNSLAAGKVEDERRTEKRWHCHWGPSWNSEGHTCFRVESWYSTYVQSLAYIVRPRATHLNVLSQRWQAVVSRGTATLSRAARRAAPEPPRAASDPSCSPLLPPQSAPVVVPLPGACSLTLSSAASSLTVHAPSGVSS